MLAPSDWRSSFDHALGTAPMLTSFFSNMPFLPRGRWSSEDPMSLLDWRPVGHGSLVDPRPRSGNPGPHHPPRAHLLPAIRDDVLRCSDRHGDSGQSRVARRAARDETISTQVQVVDPPYLRVLVDHTVVRAGAHAGSASDVDLQPGREELRTGTRPEAAQRIGSL